MIKSLEVLVIKLGYDPSNVKVFKEMIRRKNVDILALRKQLKLPTTKDPQTKEFGELEKEKESMFKIIIEQNLQIKKMEMELENLLKEKEQQANVSATIPIATNSLVGTSTTRTSIATTIAVETHSIDSKTNLAKAIGDLSLKGKKLKGKSST